MRLLIQLTVQNCIKCFAPIRTHKRMTATWSNKTYTEEQFVAPSWCSKLTNVPKSRLKLAQLPTPIHRWNIPEVPEGCEIYIKRDDMTGSTLTGNKVRKLEFLYADLLQKGCKHVITCGGIQSNHSRATAAVAAQLGLKCHLVLRSTGNNEILSTSGIDFVGNLMLDGMFGCSIYVVPRKAPYETDLKPRMEQIAEKIRRDHNEESYLIPVGGSDSLGMYGYIEAYREMLDQGILDNITDIVFAQGSGGTAEGLAVANYLSGGHDQIGIHGICVCDDANCFHGHANVTLKEVGLSGVESRDILDLVDGHKGRGYGLSVPEELEFIHEVSRTTGIVLDPVYTGKAVRGMLAELRNNPNRFKGKKILYLHTGGIYGGMDGSLSDMLKQTLPTSNRHQCYVWPEVNQAPWHT